MIYCDVPEKLEAKTKPQNQWKCVDITKRRVIHKIFLSKGTTGKQINFNSIDEILSHLNYQIVINVNIRQTKDSQFRHT